jgi:2-iminoacetate synthase ThiH
MMKDQINEMREKLKHLYTENQELNDLMKKAGLPPLTEDPVNRKAKAKTLYYRMQKH